MYSQAGKWYLTRQTFSELLHRNAQRYPDRPAQFWKGRDGALQKLSFGELAGIVREISGALLGLDVRKEEPVAIVAASCPEWVWVDYAILCAGAMTVAISADISAGEMRRQLEDSGARILFVSEASILLSLLSDPPEKLSEIIWIGEKTDITFGRFRGINLEAFREEGRSFLQKDPLSFSERWRGIQPDGPMTLVYAKDTKGDVRGILHTHASFNYACIRDLAKLPILTEQDIYLSILPLSNLLERQAGHATAMLAALPVAYASERDFKAESLEEDLRFFRPTYTLAVPLICEKLLSRLEQRNIDRDFFSTKARTTGLKLLSKSRGEDGSITLTGELGSFAGMGKRQAAEYRLADFLVYRKLRRRLGGSLRFIICAGGILPEEAGLLFLALGIPVLQGYGPAEACNMVSLMPANRILPESVGTFSKMVVWRRDEEGELLVRGSFLFRGYWKNSSCPPAAIPASKAFFPCGYRVEVSEKGFVQVREDRKNCFSLSTGHIISPLRIERLFALHPYFDRVLAVGRGRLYPILIIVPDFTKIVPVLKKEGAVFDEEDLIMSGDRVLRVPEEFLAMPELLSLFRKQIFMINRQLEPFERVGGMLLLGAPFSIKSGEMDENFTILRDVVEEKFADLIEEAYAGKEPF